MSSIVCFGELLLRLSAPEHERLLQSARFNVDVGGAEANVAVALARFGHAARLISVVADNALGEAAVGELRRHGVDVRDVRRAEGRMGLYFLEAGAVHRPSQVLYDRAGSAFAHTPAQNYDWPRLLENADLLHVSGVTPALGADAARATLDALRTARERGLHVVFDGNFRGKLWRVWNTEPQHVLREIFACADTLFADHRDIAMVLERDFDASSPEQMSAAAATAAFAAFPLLRRIAATRRVQHSVDQHELSAALHTRAGSVQLPAQTITSIIDRIGAGDAFAAGVLHGFQSGMSDHESLEFGLAAACLKHSVPGDFLRLGADEVAAFYGARRFDVQR